MQFKALAPLIGLCVSLAVQSACTGSARRLDPIAGILDAFQTYPIVALGEGLHGNNEGHAFRLALIRDPRFPSVVNDIVVEFGTARYQALMDAYVRGADVPRAELRKAWQDTTNPGPVWDTPIYEEFYRAVRDVNASLPDERKLRVLLGEPAVDWTATTTHRAVVDLVGRRGEVVDIVKREVLAKNRRALMIYGDGHFRRYSKWAGGGPGPAPPTLVNSIEQLGVRVFSIWTNTTVELERMQRRIAFWPVPSLTLVRGTRLGSIDFKYFAGMGTDPPTKMEDQYDAVLYLGPVSSITMSQLPAALCADAEYTKMRLARLALTAGGPNGAGVAQFKKECSLKP